MNDMSGSFGEMFDNFFKWLEGEWMEEWQRVCVFWVLLLGGLFFGLVFGCVKLIDWYDNRKMRGRVFEIWAGPQEWDEKVRRERGEGGGGKGGKKGV